MEVWFFHLIMAFHIFLIRDNNLRVDEFELSVVLLGHDEVRVSLRSAVLIQLKIVEVVPSLIVSKHLANFGTNLRVVENLVGPPYAIVVIEWASPVGLGSPAYGLGILHLANQAHLDFQCLGDAPASTSVPRRLSQRGPLVLQLLVARHLFA